MSKFKAPSPPYAGPGRDSGGGNKPIHRIVLHGTVSPTERGGARNIAAYFRSPAARGSAHYIVDPGEIVQTVYDSRIAWHAPPNSHSIGVEFCDWVGVNGGGTPLPMSRWDDGPHREMLARGARLVAELCLAYDVPVQMLSPADLRAGKRGICEHDDVSDAWGQTNHWDLGNFPRTHFLKLVQAEVKKLQAGPAKEPVKPAPKPTRVTRARDLLAAAAKRSKPARRKRIKQGLDALPNR